MQAYPDFRFYLGSETENRGVLYKFDPRSVGGFFAVYIHGPDIIKPEGHISHGHPMTYSTEYTETHVADMWHHCWGGNNILSIARNLVVRKSMAFRISCFRLRLGVEGGVP